MQEDVYAQVRGQGHTVGPKGCEAQWNLSLMDTKGQLCRGLCIQS